MLSLPKSMSLRLVLIVAAASVLTTATEAAELRLKQQCTVTGGLVTLGDVAEIFAANEKATEDLAGIDLFPAPAPSRRRFLRLREIQDLLLLHGVDLREHRFSGSSQVAIVATAKMSRTVKASGEKPVSFAATRRAKRLLSDAITAHLKQQTSDDLPWNVDVEPSEDHSRAVDSPRQQITITGGQAPWTGVQRFEVTLTPTESTPVSTANATVEATSSGETRRFTLDAVVTVPAAVVVALRSLPRGAIVAPGDVELRVKAENGREGDPLRSLDEVIGTQTTQAISAGGVLRKSSLRAPLLVKRGEVVTVYVLSSGIRVRTNGRARDDGSLGDLIAVESILDRKTFFAQVRAVREVEVYARAVQAEAVQ